MMTAHRSDETLIFRPRPSLGWAWVLVLALLIVIPTAGVSVASFSRLPWPVHLINFGLGLGIGVPFLLLAIWFPTMRYELDGEAITLRYGPVLRYRIPLDRILEIRRRNLAISLWSSMRLPGLALFTVPYSDVGKVKMCATAAADRILLIETATGLYGLTPADEEGLVAAIRARTGR